MEHSPAFLRLVAEAKREVREVSGEEVDAKLRRDEPFHLVDVREDHEFAEDHLPRAAHLCRGILERDVERAIPDKGAEIVLYCGGGFRSALAAQSLQKMGYRNVSSLAGGIRIWREQGRPLERG